MLRINNEDSGKKQRNVKTRKIIMLRVWPIRSKDAPKSKILILSEKNIICKKNIRCASN
jgi:hypothetical protein